MTQFSVSSGSWSRARDPRSFLQTRRPRQNITDPQRAQSGTMSSLCVHLICLLVPTIASALVEKDDPGNPLVLPSIPSLLEQLALREEKVMRQQLSTEMLPPPVTVGYAVNKPPPDPDRVDRPLNRPPVSPNKEVTETDLYLLGAIERLVYRVELMEKRMQRTEELLYHVMEGSHNNNKRDDPCPGNFTRVARNCYHFSERQFNWKSASSMCKSLGATLVELESRDEYTELVTFLQADPYLRGLEWWTGGLNPGLLWIWSSSAQPVLPKRPSTRPEDTVLGTGRCLKLAYSSTAHLYQYHGAECSLRQRYVCELQENSATRALRRLHKALKLDA